MFIQKNWQRRLFLILVSLCLTWHSGVLAQPRSGDWAVPVDFGEFVITVNPDGSEITKLYLTFVSWTCGSVTKSGSISIQQSPAWAITNNQFSIDVSISPTGNQRMAIVGAFTQTGDGASGTWSANILGTVCSGDWGPVVVSIRERNAKVPLYFSLSQNFPNPCNASTTFKYTLAHPGPITLKIFNILGKEEITIVNDQLPAGQYEKIWHAENFASGVYLYRLQAGSYIESRKLIILK